MSTDPSRRPRPTTSAALVLLVALLAACSTHGPAGDREPGPAPSSSAPAPGPAPPAAPDRLSTGDRSELVSSLPVGPRTTTEGKRVVYSQQVDLHEGEVVLAVAELQVTNDLGTNVYVGSTLLLGTSAASVTGREVSAANGENVTPGMHHGQQTKNGTYRAAAGDVGVRYVNVVAWAAASQSSDGDRIAVDQGYGRLSVLTW